MKAIVSEILCPLLAKPCRESALSDEVLFGMTVELLSAPAPGWHRVRTHYGYEGYAPDACLLFGVEHAARWERLPKRVVTAGVCAVLAEPRVQGWTLTRLTRGAVVAPCGGADGDGWQRVSLPGGCCGYVKCGFLGEHFTQPPNIPAQALRRRVAETAMTYLGTHYRWGGKTTLGIDCSGLTAMAYLLNGVTICRDARIQEGFPVREIGRADLDVGDLLFFPGHVALYLGGGKVIHATAKNGSDGVVINSLDPASPDFRADLAEGISAVGSVF